MPQGPQVIRRNKEIFTSHCWYVDALKEASFTPPPPPPSLFLLLASKNWYQDDATVDFRLKTQMFFCFVVLILNFEGLIDSFLRFLSCTFLSCLAFVLAVVLVWFWHFCKIIYVFGGRNNKWVTLGMLNKNGMLELLSVFLWCWLLVDLQYQGRLYMMKQNNSLLFLVVVGGQVRLLGHWWDASRGDNTYYNNRRCKGFGLVI